MIVDSIASGMAAHHAISIGSAELLETYSITRWYIPAQVGEFGSGLDLHNRNASFHTEEDATFLHSLALFTNWMHSQLGVRISSWFWFCWNANTSSGLNLVGLNPLGEYFDLGATTTENLVRGPMLGAWGCPDK